MDQTGKGIHDLTDLVISETIPALVAAEGMRKAVETQGYCLTEAQETAIQELTKEFLEGVILVLNEAPQKVKLGEAGKS